MRFHNHVLIQARPSGLDRAILSGFIGHGSRPRGIPFSASLSWEGWRVSVSRTLMDTPDIQCSCSRYEKSVHNWSQTAEIGQGISITAPDLLLPSLGMCSLHCSVTLPTLVPEPLTTVIVSTIETLRAIRADAFGAYCALEDHSCAIYRCYMDL